MKSVRLVGLLAAASLFAAGTASAQITVGVAGPMTGQYASFGEQLRNGANLALEDINAAGGVLKQQLKLVVGDDACDPKQARATADRLAGQRVPVVFGHFCSSSSIPASAIYNESGILQMTPASTNPALTEEAATKKWNNVFRTCGRDDAQGLVAGKFLASQYKGKKVAIIHDKSAYGKGLADETKKAMNAADLTEVMYEAITQGDKDFTALVSKMKAAGVDAMYLGGYHTEAGLLVRQSREQGLNALLVSGDALVTDEFWKITGPAGQGTLMTFAPDPRKLKTAEDVVKKFKAANYDPEGYTLYTYAAFQAWAAAVAKAGSTDVAKVSAALKGMTADTVLGKLAWDAKGDVKEAAYVWYVFKDGKYSEM